MREDQLTAGYVHEASYKGLRLEALGEAYVIAGDLRGMFIIQIPTHKLVLTVSGLCFKVKGLIRITGSSVDLLTFYTIISEVSIDTFYRCW